MEIILFIGYLSLLIFLVGKLSFFKTVGIPRNWILAGFLIKVAAGIALGLIYTYYYTDRHTADTFKYFDDSQILFESLENRPGDFFRMMSGIGAQTPEMEHYYVDMTNWYESIAPFNDNRTMIRLNALFRFVSMGYYYIHVLFVSFLSFAGMLAMVKVVSSEFKQLVRPVYLVFLLLPSVLFWGSGLLKDTLVFFTAGFAMFFFEKYLRNNSKQLQHLLLTFLFLLLLMFSKFYIFVLFIPLFVAWYITSRGVPPVAAFTGTFIATFLFCVAMPGIDIPGILAMKQQAFFQLVADTNPGSAISIRKLEPTYLSLFFTAPFGFFTALARPFITDAGPVLITLSALENTLILAWCCYALFHVQKGFTGRKLFPVFCLFYTLSYFTLIGLVTPVLGAVVRYKAQALPFLCTLLIMITWKNAALKPGTDPHETSKA